MAVLLTCRENKRGMQKTPTSTNTKSHNDQQLTATLPLGGSELRSGEGYSSLMSFVDSVIYLPSPLVPRDPPGGRGHFTEFSGSLWWVTQVFQGLGQACGCHASRTIEQVVTIKHRHAYAIDVAVANVA